MEEDAQSEELILEVQSFIFAHLLLLLFSIHKDACSAFSAVSTFFKKCFCLEWFLSRNI